MNVPFELSCAYSGTPVVKKPLSNTDNAILAAIVAAGSSADVAGVYNIVVPTGKFWLLGFSVVASAACKVELGVVNAAGSTFIPLYSTVATKNVGGGLVNRRFESNGPLVTHDNSTWFAAVRVTGDANGTILVTGDIGVFPKG